MAGITVNTGKTQFKSGPSGRKASHAYKILVVANLSGCCQRQYSAQSLSSRKIHRLDKDNFDEVFSRLGVAVSLPVLDQTLEFSDFDSLNPDYLYQELTVFSRYRQRIRQLKSKDHWREAVDALRKEGVMANSLEDPQVHEQVPVKADFLNELIGQAQQVHQQEFSVDELIRQTVAPYVEEKIDVNIDEYVQAVETAAADLLRTILHSSEFREIETHWRCLDLLNRRLDTDKACQIHIVDMGREELLAEAAAGEQSSLYQNWVAANSVPGAQHFDAIVYGDFFQCDSEDQAILKLLSGVAKGCNAELFCGLGELPFGVEGVAGWSESNNPIGAETALSELRALVQGPAFMCAPRFMVRLPYGSRTRPIDSIRFEELPQTHQEKGYLWGSGAYLAILAKAQWHQQGDPDSELSTVYIENMPLHITSDEDGDEKIVPSSEIYLTEQLLQRFADAGLLALQSVKNSDAVMIGYWRNFSA